MQIRIGIAMCLLALSPMLHGIASATVFLPSAPVYFKLSHSETRKFEALACIQPHHARLDRATGWSWGKEDHSDMGVHARCVPHRRIENHSVAFEVTCDKNTGEWQCISDELLFARVDGKVVRISVEKGIIPLSEAYAIVRFLSSAGALVGSQHWNSDSFGNYNEPYSYCRVYSSDGKSTAVHCGVSAGTIVVVQDEVGRYQLAGPIR
jgi:hypothetical protein